MTNNIYKIYKNFNGGMKFLFYVLLFYLLVSLFNIEVVKISLFGFWLMIKKITPLLVVVFIIMVVVDMIFTKERVENYLGKNSGLLNWFYVIIAGILISGPPYILYPMLGELKNKGMSNSLIAVFLFNRNVKIAFIPALIYYFGLEYTIVLSVLIILFSIINGLLVGFLVKE